MKLIQTNIGIRIIVMPGARMLMMVTKKLTAAASEATPRICRPMTQKSAFGPGENWREVRLRVAEPAGVGRGAEEEAGVEQQAAEQEDPVAERVQPRERHVARADHERDQVVEEHRAQRHDREEDHGRAVHREQLVVRVRDR